MLSCFGSRHGRQGLCKLRRLRPIYHPVASVYIRWHGGHGAHGDVTKGIIDKDLASQAKRITLIGVGANLGLTGAKGIIGTLSGSASLTADAVHSLSDLVSDGVALLALKWGSKPPDDLHPYGYGHYETLGTLGVSALLVLGAFEIGEHALESLLNISSGTPPVLEMAPMALGVAAASVLIKEALFRSTLRIGEACRSSVVIANAWHHRSDAFSSIVAIGGIGGVLAGMPYMDAAGGLLVCGLIAKTGVEIGWGAVKNLTDRQSNTRVLEGVTALGKRLSEQGVVESIHRVRCRQIGGYCIVDCHVVVSPSLSVGQAHTKGNQVREDIMAEMGEVHDVMVHVCPSDDTHHA